MIRDVFKIAVPKWLTSCTETVKVGSKEEAKRTSSCQHYPACFAWFVKELLVAEGVVQCGECIGDGRVTICSAAANWREMKRKQVVDTMVESYHYP